MTHIAEDFKNHNTFWNNLDLTQDYAISLNQDNGDCFIGFCTHEKEEINDKKYTISTPKYGMLFTPQMNGHDSLYIGPFNYQG